MNNSNLTLDDFVLLADFVEQNPKIWASLASARWAINNSNNNGLDEYNVIAKRGGKLFIVVPHAVQWLLAGKKGYQRDAA